ncbi:hypothetical protein [Microbacterium sp. YY-01]|uniref:hypothetical protein n=1 Tax=Microbacterium sp. YY-01 TaxID=3421634 RepID=UPI003D186FDE
MYILLAIIAACSLGVALHFLLPGRLLRGRAVAPALATALAAATYTIMQWLGVAESSVWLWLASVGGSLAVTAGATLLLTTVRRRSDAQQRQAMGL